MIQDIVNSIKVSLHERFSSPLLGPLVIATCAFHYRFFVILFSGEEVAYKFELLDKYIQQQDRLAILVPLLVTAAYIYILPYPTKVVYGFVRNRQKEILEIRRRTEDEFPLTEAEARDLRTKYRALEASVDDLFKTKDQEIADLRASVESRGATNPQTIDDIGGNTTNVDDEFNDFKNTEEAAIFLKALHELSTGRYAAHHLERFGDFVAWGLASATSTGNAQLTPKGQAFALRLKREKKTVS